MPACNRFEKVVFPLLSIDGPAHSDVLYLTEDVTGQVCYEPIWRRIGIVVFIHCFAILLQSTFGYNPSRDGYGSLNTGSLQSDLLFE